jgi:hypothetical protein
LTLIASVKGETSTQPEHASVLPAALLEAERLWHKAGGRAGSDPRLLTRILKLVSGALSCYFVGSSLLSGDDMIEGGEVEASSVSVTGADFSNGPVPWVRASAKIKLVFKGRLSTLEELQAWEEAHDKLDNGIVFQFNGSSKGDYLGVISEHSGIGLELAELESC